MYTLGYSFKPWTETKAIADGPVDPDYVRETAREHGIDRTSASATASSARRGRRRTRAGRSRRSGARRSELVQLHLQLPVHVQRLLQTTSRATRRSFPGVESFKGRIVHPQNWPEDIDYAGKRVVVIGIAARPR